MTRAWSRSGSAASPGTSSASWSTTVSCTRSRPSTRTWPGANTGCCASWPSSTCPRCPWWASWWTAGPISRRSWSPGSWTTPPPTGPCSPARAAASQRTGCSTPWSSSWCDCSLSNTLFRYDAGTLEAYLVDAETSERHPSLTAGQRRYDVDLAEERVYGELLDLQAGELLSPDLDPLEIAAELPRRYERLWDELTREELLRPDDQRYRIAQRLRRLNELGFDADEVELISTPDGNRLRLRTRVSESGYHARQLFLRTGLVVEENQARRLLNDITSFRAYLEQKRARPVPEMVAASQWLGDIYDPVVAAIPEDLRGRLPPAEIFHEILEHRWYMSEAAGFDVGTAAAARSYFQTVLPGVPELLSEGGSAPGGAGTSS